MTADDAVTYAELDEASAALAARLVADGVVKGDRVGLLAPNGIEWAVDRRSRAPDRRGPRAPQHAAATARVAGPDHDGVRVAPGGHPRVPGPPLPQRPRVGGGWACQRPYGRACAIAAAPFLRRLWTTDALPEASVPVDLVRALESRVRPADDLAVLFTSGSRGTPKGVIHTHGAALRATAAGLEARCVGPGERLYIPMPFFWTGGFGGGLLTALVAGATLLTEAEPEPRRTLELLATGAGHALPRLARPSGPARRRPGRSRRRPVLAARRQSRCRPAAGTTAGSGARAQPLRHDRDPSARTAATGSTPTCRRPSSAAAADRSSESEVRDRRPRDRC